MRRRVVEQLRRGADRPFTLLVAPAGSGKSTALGHLADDVDDPSAWFDPDPTCADPARFLDGLATALAPILGIDGVGVRGLGDVHARLAGHDGTTRVLLVIDDLHTIRGSTSEGVLEDLIRSAPAWLRIVAASRETPDFNLGDLLVTGHATQVGDDVLRWRPWEVERLFRDVYRDRLRPEDAARLCLRTEGWSAGLHLFHLATTGLGPVARRHLLTGLDTTPAMVRDYLTRNVLAGLPDELATFLVDTCVLGRLDAALCDDLRGGTDSARHLATLQTRRLFVVVRDDGRGLRYHEVLRSYLEASLLERDGPVEVRRRHLRAAQLLDDVGAIPDALHAYVRAEAWPAAEELVARAGAEVLSSGGHTLLDRLPRAFVRSDPWLLLARARVLLAQGSLRDAVSVYRGAARAFDRGPAGDAVRREGRRVASWLAPVRHTPSPVLDASALLQQALQGDPRRVAGLAATRGDVVGSLVAAAAQILAGAVAEGGRTARSATSAETGDLLHVSVSRLLDAFAGAAAGERGRRAELLEVSDGLDRQGLPWGGRVVRALAQAMGGAGAGPTRADWRAIDPSQDPWGHALVRFAAGVSSIVRGAPDPSSLDAAADDLDRLGAPVLGAWARAWSALGRVAEHEPGEVPEVVAVAAREARRHAHDLLVPGAEVIAELALARAGGAGADGAMARATALAAELGMALPTVPVPPAVRVVERSLPANRVRCFGGLELVLGDRPVDLDGLRPQARVVLGMLAMWAPVPVHRDRLLEALWPGGDPDTNHRRLSVLVSTLRRHLEPHAPAGEWDLVVRVGQAHALRLPDEAWVDVRAFDDAVAAARSVQRTDPRAHRDLLDVALEAYGGELLPEFGPADWIVEDRDHYRLTFAEVATSLARDELRAGDPAACVDVALAGLRADRYRSQLWSVLAAGHRALGDPAAAARARRDHRAALAELGVEPDDHVGRPSSSAHGAELQARQ